MDSALGLLMASGGGAASLGGFVSSIVGATTYCTLRNDPSGSGPSQYGCAGATLAFEADGSTTGAGGVIAVGVAPGHSAGLISIRYNATTNYNVAKWYMAGCELGDYSVATFLEGASITLTTAGSTSVNLNATGLTVAPTVAAFGITQTALASGTGAPMSVVAQGGGTGTGGDLTIGPGAGTTSNGKLALTNIITTTTVGAAGAASAMPTPVGYANIKINGTAYRVAYFN